MKARVGLEARKSLHPIRTKVFTFQLHPVPVGQWKKETSAWLREVFAGKLEVDSVAAKEREKRIVEETGRLRMEVERLGKGWRTRALRNAAS